MTSKKESLNSISETYAASKDEDMVSDLVDTTDDYLLKADEKKDEDKTDEAYKKELFNSFKARNAIDIQRAVESIATSVALTSDGVLIDIAKNFKDSSWSKLPYSDLIADLIEKQLEDRDLTKEAKAFSSYLSEQEWYSKPWMNM